MRAVRSLGFAGFVAFASVAACGGSSTHNGFFGDDSSDGGDTNDIDAASFPPVDGGPGSLFGDGGIAKFDANSLGDGQACATDTQGAKFAPLDLFVMQDTSGSMSEPLAATGTTTKWDAVKSALGTFMSDSASSGIGIGIQFFPLFAGGVPNSCAATSDCGASGGTCLVGGVCSKSWSQFYDQGTVNAPTTCTSASTCTGNGNTCSTLKGCAQETSSPCLTAGDCMDQFGDDFGPCSATLTRGTCSNVVTGMVQISCTETDYSMPAAAIAALPGNAAAITAQLNVHIPDGDTPTYSALKGAIDAARAYAMTHSMDTVTVVLSTDGIPDSVGDGTGCDDTLADIEAVAAAGLAGTPSVKTFVIGTISPADASGNPSPTTVLNGIAAAGGTGTATILSTSASTETDLIMALDKIRGQSLPCMFALPVPEAGTPDYSKVNVVYATTTGTTTVGYVETQANCDATKGGWYYNVDPSEGGVPSEVILCSASCATAQSVTSTSIQVVQGCATQTIVPTK